MADIELIDLKGDRIKISICGNYKTSRKGLVEQWCYVEQSWTKSYWRLPFPVFTEWWE